jgi:hypothetical protein
MGEVEPSGDPDYDQRARGAGKEAAAYAKLGQASPEDEAAEAEPAAPAADEARPGTTVFVQQGGEAARYDTPAGGATFAVQGGSVIHEGVAQPPTDRGTGSTVFHMAPGGEMQAVPPAATGAEAGLDLTGLGKPGDTVTVDGKAHVIPDGPESK